MQPITVPGTMESLQEIMDYVQEAARNARLGKKAAYRLRLAVEELVTNIITHGYTDDAEPGSITVGTYKDEKMVGITLEDTAPPFDPRQHPAPDNLDQSLDQREIGGLGVYLALESLDEFHYEYSDGRNRSQLFVYPPPATITRELITSKTQAMNSLISHVMINTARVHDQANKLESRINDLIADFAQYGKKPPVELSAPMQQLKKNLDASAEYSQRIIDQLTQFQELLDVSALIFSSLELDDVLGSVMDTIINLTGAERAYLMLRNSRDEDFTVQAARNAQGSSLDESEIVISRKIIEQVLEEGKPVITVDALHDLRFGAAQSVLKNELRSILCVPLTIRGEDIGLLYADNNLREGAFSDELIPLSTIFATQAATAIENARLFEKSRTDARLERDLQIGQEIQAGFLPKTIPQVKGWQIAAYFHPARKVAGDFYDVFTVSRDKLGFVVGDVCDKGVGAALFMALFRSLLRAFAQQHHSLSWMDDMISEGKPRSSVQERRVLLATGAVGMKNAITLTNDYIANNHGDANMFATIFFGMIDPTSGSLTYINAGHNPPLIVAADGMFKERLTLTGPAVGMMPDMEFEISQTKLEAGDTLVCFTDGLTEAKNAAGAFFGEERVLQTTQTQARAPVEQLVNRLRDDVHAHMQSAEQFDDITLIALRNEARPLD